MPEEYAMQTIKAEKQRNIKWRNERAIVMLLKQNSEMTIPEIAEKLELSRTAATKTITELCSEGLLKEVGIREATVLGGKPPRLYSLNASYKYTLILLIGNDHISTCIADMSCSIVASNTVTKPGLTGATRWDDLMDIVIDAVHMQMDLAPIAEDRFCMMVVQSGGIVDHIRGEIVIPIGYRRTSGYALKEELEKRLGLPFPIVVDNVGRFFGYAELLADPSLEEKSVATINSHDGGGISGSVIDHGKLLYGRHGYQGEFGHLLVRTDHARQCICGNYGCLESALHKDALIEMYEDKKTAFPEATLPEGERGDLRGILKAAETGDRLAQEISSEIARVLSRAIYNIVLMYDPDVIILQSALAAGGDYFMKRLKEYTRICPGYGDIPIPEIRFSELSLKAEEVGNRGAALYALNTYLFGKSKLKE